MAKAQKVLDALSENEGFTKRVVLPESFYIARISAGGDIAPSQVKGTPGWPMVVTVTEGPFAGSEISTTQWFSPKMINLLKHLVTQVTGKALNGNVLDEYEMSFTDGGDFIAEFAQQFEELDGDQKTDLMSRLCHVDSWDGKNVVVQLALEDREFERDGELIQFQQNRVTSIFALNHPKKGKTYVVKTCHPLQVQAVEQMA